MTLDRENSGPRALLDRAAAELVYSLSVEAADWAPKRYGYRVGPVGLLVGEKTRSEVVRSPSLAPLPHAPAWLLGVMNLRGHLVPVADLRALCGEATAARSPSTVLVLDSGEGAIGVPIDGLPTALAELRELTEWPAAPPAIAAYTGTAFEGDGSHWLEFDHDGYFCAIAQGAGVQN